jgi:hypothetical protein
MYLINDIRATAALVSKVPLPRRRCPDRAADARARRLPTPIRRPRGVATRRGAAFPTLHEPSPDNIEMSTGPAPAVRRGRRPRRDVRGPCSGRWATAPYFRCRALRRSTNRSAADAGRVQRYSRVRRSAGGDGAVSDVVLTVLGGGLPQVPRYDRAPGGPRVLTPSTSAR